MKGSVKQLMNIFLAVFVLFICALPSPAQQVFYIYRNDGIIHTFFTANIDSMTCSTMDVDSIEHGEFVVQEVYTSDSVYRIPMETIDSVSFVTPETKYRPGVKVLEGDLKEYIVSRDSLTLLFRTDTPVGFLPVVGDKLVSTVADDVLGSAFLGQVERVVPQEKGIEVICVPVDLMEVFDYYYGIMQKEKEPESQVQVRGLTDGFYASGMRRLSPGKLSYDWFSNLGWQASYSVDDNLSLNINTARATMSITPIVDYNACLIVNKDYGVNVSVTAIGNYTMEELLALSGSISYEEEVKLFETAISIPEALVDLYFEFGVFSNMSTKISLDQSLKQEYRHVFHWEWSSKGHSSLKKVNQWLPLSNTCEGKVALEGEWSVGAYGKMGFAFIATSSLDIAEIGLRGDGGLSCEGKYVPYKSDFEHARTSTELYNKIKDTELATYWYYGLSAEAKLFKWSVSHEIPNFFNIPLNRKERIASVRSVPLFSGTKLEWEGDGVYSATAKATGTVSKTDVGFALINQKNEEDATYTYSAWGYQGELADLSALFFNKSRSADYTLYPLVKYMDMELIAEPSAVDESIPEVITLPAFSVSESSAVLSGEVSGISGSSSDCRYGFFYGTSSVPSVGGQEILVGSNGDGRYTYSLSGLKDNTTYYYCAYLSVGGQYTYGDVRSFTTEKKKDEITPGQLVDLGLSVKWAGWNVGASRPEEYGGYYAWGELHEKSDYDMDSYQYWDEENDEWIFIGNNISGTQYDVARAQWGGSWRMPTLAECQELIDKCTWTWTTYNGVKGQKVTGPNGNSIFLPAAGYRDGTSVDGQGSYGYYWSGTLYEGLSYYAYCLHFRYGDAGWDGNSRYYGLSVRPVSE